MMMYMSSKALRDSMLPHQGGWSISEAILTAGQATADNLPAALAEIQYMIRVPTIEMAERATAVLDANADAAARMTGCRFEKHWVSKSRPGLANHAMATIAYEALSAVGPPRWGDKAKAIAREIQVNAGMEAQAEPFLPECERLIAPQEAEAILRRDLPPSQVNSTSDDYTEMCWHAPTARIYVARPALRAPAGFAYPSWAMNALGGIPETIDPMVDCASRTVALTALRLIEDAEARRCGTAGIRRTHRRRHRRFEVDRAALRLRPAHRFPLAGICHDAAWPRLVDTNPAKPRRPNMTLHERIVTDEPFTLQRRNPAGGTKPLSGWGFRNETDPLTDVLLGSPAFLRHLATSSLSRKHLREAPCNIQTAQAQHKDLVAAYENFGVKIHWHEPTPELPMQVYSRDSSVMTPYGAIITAMANWWRRGENYAAIRTYEKLGIPIYDMVTAGTFEGGDFNVIEDGVVLIGCGGARTQEEGARQVQEWFEKEGWETRLAFIDEYYVHIDLMVVPIAEKLTAVCLACTEPGIVDWLKGKGHEIIDVPFQDTMALGCNFMSLGKDRVIAPTVSKTLIGQLKARGFEVAAVDMSEISKTGGGIHCMAQALKRDAG